jgi:diguanylate cyclase (GGDEF)-like protein
LALDEASPGTRTDPTSEPAKDESEGDQPVLPPQTGRRPGLPPLAYAALGVLSVPIVAGLDWWTGPNLRMALFYVLPVLLVAWHNTRGVTVGVSVLVDAVWSLTSWFDAGMIYGPWIVGGNLLANGLLLTALGLAVCRLRTALEAERRHAFTCPLTGLPNARMFFASLSAEVERCRRYAHPFVLVYVDLDGFKAVNDSLGHQAGDQVLRQVAQRLQAGTRATDTVARLGGDEFAMVLAETDADGARTLLTRLQVALREVSRDPPVSASLGAVVYRHPPVSTAQAMARVDRLMYEGKRQGKDRLVLIEDEGPGASGA